MTWRARRILAVALCGAGVLLLAHSAVAYLRADRFRRAVMNEAVPLAADPTSRRPSAGAVIGTLEIPRLRVCSPIVEGDGERELARGIGHLPDTPLPWEPGNAALAGHRDTAFRPLARIRAGDGIAVSAAGQRYEYTVREIRVVEPDDLSVLQPGPAPSLTLITCYPFRFIGPAPKRFIVRAERAAARHASGRLPSCRPRSP